jgi:LCP family protein required for cell wall assembly
VDDERPPSLRRGIWVRFLIAAVLIVLLCGGATAAVTLRTANQIAAEVFPALNHINTPKGLVTPVYSGGPETFLILGSDKRYGSKNAEERDAPPRSDTILLVRFDPEQEQTSVLSIPRDLLVHINGPEGRVYYPAKINSAYTIGSQLPEHDGAANLAAETVKQVLPGLQLNGIIDVTFTGFIRLVDKLGCVYVNVDHRYFNENNGTPETDYTNINLQPGYQKLCYENALAYVRYRHDDSDFVRVARQQDFLRDLREQVSTSDLLGQIHGVAKAVGRAISTNFEPTASELFKLAKLILFSQTKPLRQVEFKAANVDAMIRGSSGELESYVTTTPQLARETLHDFLDDHQRVRPPSSHASSHHGHHHHSHHSTGHTAAAIGLYPTSSSDEEQAVSAALHVPFPVLYPALQTGPAVQETVRHYRIADPQGHLHHAYVVAWQQNVIGGYYDFEGTDWLNPPIIDHPQETRQQDGRNYMIFTDGEHIHMVAWREHHVLYWVINTLREELTNAQMFGIADSAQPLR